MFQKAVLAAVAVFLLWGGTVASGGQGGGPAAVAAEPQKAPPEIYPDKHTVLGLYVTAKEAYDLWQKDQQRVKIIDCRTPEEYAFVGHAPMAANVPSKFVTYAWDEKKKEYAMQPNPNFVKEINRRFAKGDTILLMCRSGNRSAASADLLARAGFTKVYNVTDGFEGDKFSDPGSPNRGKRLQNGWKNSNLPWTGDLDVKLMYFPQGQPQGQ
jgi:rhodanese-related sulfurtransferase